jgi:hypothetical protein
MAPKIGVGKTQASLADGLERDRQKDLRQLRAAAFWRPY